ncbi:hypothetical protein RUM44_000897 [Polyplax serrata]|uniref:proline--tRNA ligase n=1 Tax=Polyplax serrata TaxID=468196 RepID=A0ABR1B6D0_POLSC
MRTINKISKVLGFQMVGEQKASLRSKSQKLFAELGLARYKKGFVTLSPILVKSLRKLESIVRQCMDDVSAVEIILPSITDRSLLEKSGRNHTSELFCVKSNNGKDQFLNPTCEESITDLISVYGSLGQKSLPCRLYQITNKFRDEMRFKSGLMRTKEFLMKDLYCFDMNEESCKSTYQEVQCKYHDFFKLLQVPYICLRGTEGDIGGLHSTEFHFLSDAGEDTVLMCKGCGHIDKLKMEQDNTETQCSNCSGKNVKICKTIEVGHAFNLGTRYTEPFKATFVNDEGKHDLLQMSCFGLGLTRILAASVEVLSLEEQIRWPAALAPYLLSVIPPKAGSHEEKAASNLTSEIFNSLYKHFGNDIIIEDRTMWTVGKRLKSIEALGVPYAVVIGKEITKDPPQIEIQNIYSKTKNFVHVNDVLPFLKSMMEDNQKGVGLEARDSISN